jgi:D-glycerate 3-kinase
MMSDDWLLQIFTETVDASRLVSLQQAELADFCRASAFNITPANVCEVIQQRSLLLKSVISDFYSLCQNTWGIQTQAQLATLWNLWLPLGIKIADHRKRLDRPMIQGILGLQGTGKTTMSQIISLILRNMGYRTLCLSLDDLYKTYNDRLTLLSQDQRLIWRGPPGTHDIHLGSIVLDQVLQRKSPINIPRFDKSAYHGAGDRTTPEIVSDIDLVLFEGWFVGVYPIDPETFNYAPPPIVTDDDRAFARDMNIQLHNYVPLWDKLDSLIVLYPKDYRLSLEWRQQAERQMIAAGKSGMNDAQVVEFVHYFWRSLHPELFVQPLLKSPQVDLVIEINADRSLNKVYSHKQTIKIDDELE